MLYRASGVDSITDYNGFSPLRSLEVDRVTRFLISGYFPIYLLFI